jgi:hypothetical protein
MNRIAIIMVSRIVYCMGIRAVTEYNQYQPLWLYNNNIVVRRRVKSIRDSSSITASRRQSKSTRLNKPLRFYTPYYVLYHLIFIYFIIYFVLRSSLPSVVDCSTGS